MPEAVSNSPLPRGRRDDAHSSFALGSEMQGLLGRGIESPQELGVRTASGLFL